MRTHAPAPVHYIRVHQLAERWGCSDMTLLRMRRRDELPEPTRLSKGIVGWRSDVIEAIEAARTPRKGAPQEAA